MSATFPKENLSPLKDNYRLGEELGSGAFSVVVKGKHKETNEIYAVKIVDKNSTGHQEMFDEINMMSKLSHENIVNFKEIFNRRDGYYVILEYITGGELFDRIIELQRYTEKDAAHVMRQALTGLKHMHDKNIVHRDLKPENILLASPDPTAIIKLADFGFSRVSSKADDCHELVGTPEYMAPELVALRDHDAGYGKAVDVWALGVVLYILLSGIHPFQIEDENQMLANIQAGRWRWMGSNWSKLSEASKELITHMMDPNPKSRYTVDQCLNSPWLKEEQSDVALDGIADEIRKYQARHKMKTVIRAVIASNRMRMMLGKFADIKVSSGGSAHVLPKKKKNLNWKEVQITCLSGTDLAPKDLNGKSDPYLKIIANGHLYHKTDYIKANLNPKWNSSKEVVSIPYASALKIVDVECWDYDKIGSDDFMGECAIDLSEYEIGKEVEATFKLTVAANRTKKKKTNKVSGSLRLKVLKVPA